MYHEFLASFNFGYAIITGAALGVSCAVLSVMVVLRRWAFIGEGISHAGFGGMGTAWILSLIFPSLGNDAGAYAVAVLFCIGTALAIGFVGRSDRVASDAAIGIFVVASLAWGIMAMEIQAHVHPGAGPANWETYFIGDISFISRSTMFASVSVAAAVILIVIALSKEILYYAFDPLMAQVSGVRVGFMHYLLMILLAAVIVIGMRIVGNVLITALLVLPGATALMLSRKLLRVVLCAIVIALIGTLGGLFISREIWPFLHSGPAIVLLLFIEFVAGYAWGKIGRRTEGSW